MGNEQLPDNFAGAHRNKISSLRRVAQQRPSSARLHPRRIKFQAPRSLAGQRHIVLRDYFQIGQSRLSDIQFDAAMIRTERPESTPLLPSKRLNGN